MARQQPPLGESDDAYPVSLQLLRAKRREARSLYWRGWPMVSIASELDVEYPTVASWKRRDKWHDAKPIEVIDDRIEARIAALIDGPMSEGDMKRIDHLMRMLERSARVHKYMGEDGRETDLNPNIERRNDDKAKAKRAEKRKNFLTDETVAGARR